MIEIKNLSKSFGDRKILNNISAVFSTGKTNLVIGASGSGKTVLMKSIVGLVQVDEGEIIYNNKFDFNHAEPNERKLIRQQIGMLFQNAALFDSMTVEQNVMFPLDMFTTMTRKEKMERVRFCLERVELSQAHKLMPNEISGGMKKRVGIARAIVLNPKYLFCDEPNSGLDPKTSLVIDKLIREITIEFNITTIINTHDMNSVAEIGDYIIFLYKGEINWEGTSKDILYSDSKQLNEFVFASRFLKEYKELRQHLKQ